MRTQTATLQVEFWSVDRLIPYARNARTHSEIQVNQIAASITEFGFNNPVLVEPNGGIIAGHGRVLAARTLGLSHVPVIVLSHLTENQKRAFMLADNKLALNAGWDLELLRLEVEALTKQDFPVELTGFGEKELAELLEELTQKTILDPDEAPEPPEKAASIPGDLWILGEHRLLCGDGTRSEDLARLLEGKSCDLVFTDLACKVDCVGKSRAKMKVANDDLGSGFLLAACRAMLDVSLGPLYVCMSSGELHRLHKAFTEAGGHWSTYIIWATNTFTLGRSDYQHQYEPILYGWREGAKHYWCGGRNQGDLWFLDKLHRNDPTMKPVAIVERAIENSSRKGNLVLDPFAGSGSTVIACENTGRQARAVETDPRYADAAVKRWQTYTGRCAVLDQDGRSFDQVASDRLANEVVPGEPSHG